MTAQPGQSVDAADRDDHDGVGGQLDERAEANAAVPAEVAAALAEADRLVADGRGLEAIDILRRANASGRSSELEARLMQVRHRAYGELLAASQAAGAPTTPDPGTDPFPADPALPEIDPEQLDADVLTRAITHRGCLTVRHLFSPEQVAQLVSGIDSGTASFGRWLDEQGGPEGRPPWMVPFEPQPPYPRTTAFQRQFTFDGGGMWTVDNPRLAFDLFDMVERGPVGPAVTGYLGERPALSQDNSTLRRVSPTLAHGGWHQDGNYYGAETRAVNMWVALTPCGGDRPTPGLDLVPRRVDHALESGTEGAWFWWSIADDVVEHEAADAPVVRPRFEPGDALFFDGLLVHRTGLDPGMTDPRYAIELWFFAPSSFPENQVPLVF